MKSRRLNFLIATAIAAVVTFMGFAAAQNPVPMINQPLVPDATKPGGVAFTLTINGTGFVSGSVVHWNGSARATTFVSPSKLTATIAASDIATSRTASVTVVNPGPGGASNVAFFGVTPPTSSVPLEAAISYVTADRSYGVAVGDFNNDGKLDLAVANFSANSISVLLGNGDGTFQTHVDYATGSSPHFVAVGDFNGDGKLDLAVANLTGNSISVLLGDGDGTFHAQVEYATGSSPSGVAVGDFNRDGKLDLAVGNSTDNNVGIFLGNGDGTFQPPVNYSAGLGSGSVAVGDFNRDGKLDLVVADNGSDNINVLLGKGDGTFQPAVSYGTGPNPTSVAVADFNADGKLDLVVATNGNASNNTVSILLGNGDGTFQAHVDYQTGSSNPASVAVGDFNGDGKPDLVVADLFSSDVRLLLGNGDGTFTAAASYAAGSNPSSVALGDFIGDGRLDIAVADAEIATVSVLLQSTVLLSKPGLTFADQVIHTSGALQNVTLTNLGLLLSIDSIAITGADANDFSQTHTCGLSVPPQGSCTITVTFTPTLIGSRNASLTITDNAEGSPQVIPLTGTGVVSGPNATLSTSSLTFATQLVGSTSPAQSVTLSDYGTVALTINSIMTGPDPADFHQTSTCGSSVAPGASCTINVTFTPAQHGPRTANLSLTDNAPGSPQRVSVTGAGTVVKLNPGSLGFGIHPVGTGATHSTTLTNVGSTAVTITGIVITGADIDEFSQTNTCGTSVGAGESCTITVTFKPREAGSDSADVSIADNGGGSPQHVPLSGTGCTYYRGHCTTAADLRSPVLQSALGANSTALPRPSGSSPVGTRVMDLADSTRDDPFLADGTKRELLVRFWYPADPSRGCTAGEYTSPRVWSYFSKLAALPLPEVTTNSCLEAPITEGAHPVVVFTHGYTATFTDYSFIFEDLASRGYVVASVDHTYEATAVEFPDGRFVKSVLGSHIGNTWRMDDQSMSQALLVRSEDLNFVVNELERLNTAASPFTGKLDTSRIGMMGHSLGGEAALSAIERDVRFRAGVLIDAVLTDASPTGTDRAILILAAGREQWSESDCRFWDQLRGPRLAVNLRGAEHVTPSDLVWLAKGAVKTGSMGPEKTIAATRDYIAAFLDRNLRGNPTERLLTGPSPEYPDADVTTHEQPLCRRP